MADQWNTSPGPRGGTIGMEPFDTGYGGGFQVQIDAPDAIACKLVEDGGAFRVHRPPVAHRPRRLMFVAGTMRVEARLTRTDDHGTVTGLAGSCGAGAVLVDADRPLRFDRVTIGRAAIFTTGQRVELLPQRYVNTHHRPMLAAEAWNQGPGLPAGQRSSLLEAVQHGRYGDGDLRWITL